MKWEAGGCSHAIAHFLAGETEAQGDGITCFRLYSVGGGQVGAQVWGLRAKLTFTPDSPLSFYTPSSQSLVPWLVPGLNLKVLAWGPGVGCCRGLE